MNRNKIVTRLIAEGFTSKTLSQMNDKQLMLLSSKIIKEGVDEETTLISKKSPTFNQDLANAKKQNKTIETYEQTEEEECSECNQVEVKEETPKKGKKITPAATWNNLKESEIDVWVKKLIKENKTPITKKGEILSAIKQKLNEQQLEKSKLPLDTADTVYADAVSMEQSTAQQIANNNARAKFVGKFPNKHFIKVVETAHKTSEGDYRYIVGLKLKEEGNQEQKTDDGQIQKNDLKEQETMVKPKTNVLPDWMKFDNIKNNAPVTTPVKTPTRIKPGEAPKPRNPYQPGPGINPRPKAKF